MEYSRNSCPYGWEFFALWGIMGLFGNLWKIQANCTKMIDKIQEDWYTLYIIRQSGGLLAYGAKRTTADLCYGTINKFKIQCCARREKPDFQRGSIYNAL